MPEEVGGVNEGLGERAYGRVRKPGEGAMRGAAGRDAFLPKQTWRQTKEGPSGTVLTVCISTCNCGFLFGLCARLHLCGLFFCFF